MHLNFEKKKEQTLHLAIVFHQFEFMDSYAWHFVKMKTKYK